MGHDEHRRHCHNGDGFENHVLVRDKVRKREIH